MTPSPDNEMDAPAGRSTVVAGPNEAAGQKRLLALRPARETADPAWILSAQAAEDEGD